MSMHAAVDAVHDPGVPPPVPPATAVPPTGDADAALRTHPHGFELFAALRLLERTHPQRAPLGRSARPGEDMVRLRQPPSLAFAPGEVAGYRSGDAAGPAVLDTPVLGLFGPNGPLPLHLTEYAIERAQSARDTTFRAFADVFHHRMLSLFYRAWADAQPVVQAERRGDDRFAFHVGALVGLPRPGAGDDPVVATGLRHFAGRLVSQVRNAEGLRALLVRAFDVPVEIVGFVAEWMPLPDEARLRLGRRTVATLGGTAVLGARVRGAQHRFRLRLGPLDAPRFRAFLPGGVALRDLAALVRGYVGDGLDWDVQLLLRAVDVPTTRLGVAGRMGLDTWLGRRAWDLDDAGDVIVRPAARAHNGH
ncbi:type VI secretion system baseplate subunit TssG [Luteimonas sp. BDR2-5]|nr:type VI secretion system baseplate subunit TssG [Luteimonas sp. BDR2-5]MCD9027859.1 type VI secretion system baseplate subunit TssG [Luteimonas sp. BDR2-5]